MNLTALNQENLKELSKNITTPKYKRSDLKTGIVHIGVGGFHRAHQAYYIHKLLEKGSAKEWAICGVGLREADRNIIETLSKQNGLYTLIIQHPDGAVNSEVIGSIHEVLLAVNNPELVINKMADSQTKIVSLTITEGGYNFNPQTGAFDFDNPLIKQEIAHPDQPKTTYGYLTAALRKRKAENIAPFSILSCDNIQHNGDVARKMVLAFAQKQDPELAAWIESEVTFPNTMVDRITPVTKPEDIAYLEKNYKLKDEWPVICEPFIQWVVEDKFSNGRPPLEELGVQFVKDVTPYETMKIRLLNAGHSVLGILGAIHGHPTIDACMQDAVLAKFMRQFMDLEATPVLGEIAGMNLDHYKDSLEQRFANPNIKDSVSRICSESSAKLPKFLIPTLTENLNNGGSIKFTTLILAAWCFYSEKGLNEKNEPLEIIDVMKDELHQAALASDKNPMPFIELKELFGELSANKRFTEEYKKMIHLVYSEKSIRETMQKLI